MTITINPQSILSILTLRYDLTKISPIRKLKWNDFVENKFTNNEKVIEENIKNNFRSIIKDQKKVSIALSSGVDSTLLLAILRKTLPKIEIDSFSIRFHDSIDESVNAEKIAKENDSTHHIINVENYFQELPKAISITQLPFWDIHWYYLVKYASNYSKTIISGDGGDELFGGYTFRYKKFLSMITKNSSTREKTIAYLNCHERDWVIDQEKIFGSKLKFDWEKIYSEIDKYFDNSLSPLTQVFLADFNGKLVHNWSIVNSRFNEYFKMKSIIPLTDDSLIKIAIGLPNNLKYNVKEDVGKMILRKILKKYNVEKFLIAKKQGFSINTEKYWNVAGKKLCEQYVLEGELVKNNFINKQWILKYIHKKDLNVRYVNKFFGILAFEIWYRLFITKSISPNDKIGY